MNFAVGVLTLFFELFSVLLCLSLLYGETFKFDRWSAVVFASGFLNCCFTYLVAENYILTIALYIIFVCYCGMEYGWKWKAIVVNMLLHLLIVGSFQIVYMMLFYAILETVLPGEYINLLVGVASCLTLFFTRKFKWVNLSRMIQEWNPVMNILLIILGIFVVMVLILYKIYMHMYVEEYLLIFLYTVAIVIILFIYNRYKMKRVEIDAELQCYDTYIKTYEELIEIVRMRQHEFDNHLNSIIGLQYTTDSYQELKEAQALYINEIKQENKYNKLLKEGNPFFIGFLFSKFQSLEKAGVSIEYQVRIGDFMDLKIPVYKLIEVANDLITNAAEALEQEEDKRLLVRVAETEEKMLLEIMNRGRALDPEYISGCFEKGYSTKGTGRGLGLYHVKEICERYHMDLSFSNEERDGDNWICFRIHMKKPPK
ncbi:MAG: GHKL domain-containing protein [Lachnospiraceae bacterium]|nr:GHKL domain-containing protein [Lachnospiraceae bacterium]